MPICMRACVHVGPCPCVRMSMFVCVFGFLETKLSVWNQIISTWHLSHWVSAKISFKKDFFLLAQKCLKTTESDYIYDSF